MITKEQIEQASFVYKEKKRRNGRPCDYAALDFVIGANFVLGQLDPLCADGSALIEKLQAENERLRKQAAIHEANAVQYSAEVADANSRLHATKRENDRLRGDLEFTKTASNGKSRIISMLMAENERFRTVISEALAISLTEAWDELQEIRKVLEKA